MQNFSFPRDVAIKQILVKKPEEVAGAFFDLVMLNLEIAERFTTISTEEFVNWINRSVDVIEKMDIKTSSNETVN